MTYVTSYPWGSTEFGISLYESLTEKPLSYSGSSKNNCFFLFIPLRSEPQFPNGPPWSPSMVVNNHATICISSSNRDFLGTKEASLLLMAMFLLAVFYHGQQVIWHFPLTAVDYLAFPIAVKFTWEAVTHLCNKWPLVACSKWWFFFCFVFFPLASLRGLQDLSVLTRGWTRAPAVKASRPNHRTSRELPASCDS